MSENNPLNPIPDDNKPEMPQKAKKKGFKFSFKRNKKTEKIKNQLLLRRGGYSVLITALFLAAVIVVNILIGALSDRFNLEYDLSAEKQSTMTEENVEYIKDVSDEISIVVCAGEDGYSSNIDYIAQNMYSVSEDYQDYYNQTLRFIKKYPEYNKKISVEFIDMYSNSKFTEIYSKYTNESLSYGDIIVSANIKNDETVTERHKILTFNDVYELSEDSYSSYYAMYGLGSSYTISGNNIESALSGAIEYVIGVDKNAVMLTGHSPSSAESYYTAYEELLSSNNFNVETLDSTSINYLPDNCDVAVIIQPDTDFSPAELELLNEFLYNNGELKKTLIYVGGATVKALPNLNEFLSDWGITVGEGKLFETSGDYCLAGDPSTLSFRNTYGAVTASGNAPITVGAASESDTEANMLISTPDSIVTAPVGAGSDWNDYTSADNGTYALVAYGLKSGTDSNGDDINSAVFAFSSAEFISPSQQNTMNTQYAQLAAEAFADSGVSEISFTPKTISSADSFTPTEAASNTLKYMFEFMLPLAMLAIAIIVYIRRINAK